MIDKAHEAYAEFVAEASSGVVAFAALGRPEVVMVKGCLFFQWYLPLLSPSIVSLEMWQVHL